MGKRKLRMLPKEWLKVKPWRSLGDLGKMDGPGDWKIYWGLITGVVAIRNETTENLEDYSQRMYTGI